MTPRIPRWPLILTAASLLAVAAILTLSACQQPASTPTPTPLPTIHGLALPCGPIQDYREFHERFLHWAGGGSHLVFNVGDDTIWSLDVASGHPQLVVDVDTDYDSLTGGHLLGYGFYADVHPDDTRLVYSTCEYSPYVPGTVEDQQGYKIAAVSVDGTGKELLTDSRRFVNYPALSSDGSRIAFITIRGGLFGQTYEYYPYNPPILDLVNLAILPSDAQSVSDLRLGYALLRSPNRIELSPPAWSPDDKYLAYLESKRNPQRENVLHTVLSDGTGTSVRIRPTTALPTWAPDSSRLAFGGLSSGWSVLYTVKPDGSDLRILWRGDREAQEISEVSWSPDGVQILFAADHTYLIGTDGSGLRRLEGIPEDYDGVRPVAWSPDGSKIAIYNPNRGISTVGRDGTGFRTLMKVEIEHGAHGRVFIPKSVEAPEEQQGESTPEARNP